MPTEPAEILTRCFGTGKTFPRQMVFNYAAASPAPACQQFLSALRSLEEKDLNALTFEAMCVLARTNPMELLGAILTAAKSLKAQESALRAIMAHPDVIQATIDTAKIPGASGFADRKMLHEAVGFLRTKKGGVEINFGFGRPEEERDEDSDADEAWDDAFPDLGSQIQEWSENKHKLLEGGK